MLVVEDQSTIDIHDCYMRSIRKDSFPQHKNMSPEIENAFIKQQLDCEEVGVLVDPKGWITASQYKKLGRSASFMT